MTRQLALPRCAWVFVGALALCNVRVGVAQVPDVSFEAAQVFQADTYTTVSMGVGDFNGDGFLDLVTPGSVLLGDGHGGFQPPRSFANLTSPSSVAVGDFNGDGRLDL